MRDRRRVFTLLLALTIIGFSLPASFITGNTAPAKFIDEGLKLASPTVEFTLEVLEPVNASLAEKQAILEKAYENYVLTGIPGNLVHGKGGILALRIALHAYFTEKGGSIYDSKIHIWDRNGHYVYSLSYGSFIVTGVDGNPHHEFAVYKKDLIAISPLSNDTIYLSWISGRPPTPGHTPVEAAVDERFAGLMGWKLGETIDFLGIHAVIVGIYKYKGGLDGLHNAYPVLLVDKSDLLRLASMEADYINGLEGSRLDLALAILGGYAGGGPLQSVRITNGTSVILPWLPLNPGKVPREYREAIQPALLETLEGDFYADLNRSAVVNVLYHLSPRTLAQWHQTINSQVYDRVASSLGAVIVSERGDLIAGSQGVYYESYIYRVKNYNAILLVTASEESGKIFFAIENQYQSAVSVFSLAVAVTTIFFLGWLTGSDLLKIIIGDWRPRLAVLVARGSSSNSLHRGISLLLALLVIAGGFAGYLIALSTLVAEDLPFSMGFSKYVTVTTVAILSILYLLLYRTSGKLTSRIRPVEAIRPVYSIASTRRSKRGVSAFTAIVVFSTLLVGVYGGPDELFEAIRGLGPLVEVLLALLVMLGMLGVPIAPLLSSYLSATIIAGNSYLYHVVAKRVTRLAGVLARYAYESARRLEGRFLAGLLVPVMAGSLLMGISLAIPALSHIAKYASSIYAGSGSFDVAATIASIGVAKAQLEFTVAVSWMFLALSLYTLLASVFALLENEVLVARIRGASPRQALGFALGVLSQAGAHSFVASIAGGVLTWLVLLGVFNLIHISGVAGSSFGMAWLAEQSFHGLWPVAGIGLAVATAFLVPLLVGIRVSKTRDLSRIVREGGVL